MKRIAAPCATLLLVALVTTPAPAAERLSGVPGSQMLFSADAVQYDQDQDLVIAKGNVEISQNSEILLADMVTYNQRTDTVTASGHVSLMQPEGDIFFADYIQLHDKLRDGFVDHVRLLLSDRSRMAGNTGRRVGGTRTEVRRGVYSPCDLCRDDPSRPPVWQIKAEQLVDDKDLQIIEYHDATMEIDGIPVFWLPYLSTPDPSVKRQSGFLAPSFGGGSSTGFRIGLPYYFAIAPDKDATFEPIFTTQAGIVLDGQYRQRWGFGKIVLNGSVAFDSESQSAVLANPGPPSQGLRGHFFGKGEFDIDNTWRTGFDLEAASDLTYLLRYHFPYPNSNFLTSQIYAENFAEGSYANISAYGFQSLNPNVSTRIQPFVMPTASYSWTGQPDDWGGRWTMQGSFLDLLRIQGTDMRRASAGAAWAVPFDGLIGDKFILSTSLRGDAYYSNDVLYSANDTQSHDPFVGRVFPQVGLEWHYPWVRHDSHSTELIEPILAAYAAPNGGNPAGIPNEDSQGLEFDETSLFRANRFPGYDRVDGGQRVDYGIHTAIYDDTLGSSSFLFGESFSLQNNDAFLPGSGLGDHRSDFVGGLVVSPSRLLDFRYSFRLDKSDFAMRRQQAGISVGPTNLRLNLTYTSIDAIPGIANLGTKANQISGKLNIQLTPYWSAGINEIRNVGGNSASVTTTNSLTAVNTGTTVNALTLAEFGTTINSGLSLTYQDECLSASGAIVQSGVRLGDVHPGISVLFTFVFKNLGEITERAASFGG